MIAFRNFALRRGERLLLSNVDLALHAGWRLLSMPTGLRQDAEHDPAIPGR